MGFQEALHEIPGRGRGLRVNKLISPWLPGEASGIRYPSTRGCLRSKYSASVLVEPVTSVGGTGALPFVSSHAPITPPQQWWWLWWPWGNFSVGSHLQLPRGRAALKPHHVLMAVRRTRHLLTTCIRSVFCALLIGKK